MDYYIYIGNTSDSIALFKMKKNRLSDLMLNDIKDLKKIFENVKKAGQKLK